jgi:hypothetical protein
LELPASSLNFRSQLWEWLRIGPWIADEWVTQLLRQGHSQVFKRYSQMKLQMKRKALEKINR